MKGRLILDGEAEPGGQLLVELDGVETPSGEKLEIAALTPVSTAWVAHHLGRTAELVGCPVFVYTQPRATGGGD